MKIFSWINDFTPASETSDEGSSSEPPLPSLLQGKLEELKKLSVRDVMVPRALVAALDADVQIRRSRKLKSTKVPFFIVYKGDLDHVLGWVAKEQVLQLLTQIEESSLEAHIQPVGSVLESTSVAELPDLFLKSQSPLLVVKNNHGTTTGVLPLTELVELLFGFELSPSTQHASTSDAFAPQAPRGFEIV